MIQHFLPLKLVGRFFLMAQWLVIAGVFDVGAAFVPNVGNVMCSSRSSFVPGSFGATQRLFYDNEGSSGRSRNITGQNRSDGVSMSRGRRRKPNNNKNNSHPSNKTARHKKISRPASFAAIRKEMRKGNESKNNEATETTAHNVIDSATITRISKRKHRDQQKELQAKRRGKEERMKLKLRVYQLSIDSERGFRSTPQQAKEMKEIFDRLTELNPTREPAWSYYGKSNPLTRQLYQSLANKKGKTQEEETLASLEGKWILTYTNVPSIVSLASNSNRLGFAKLGRIGQECTPFPDYTVRTIIEWKRPDWVHNLETTLPRGLSNWLFGKEESSVLQKTTLRAKATPDDPTSWGVSKVPRVFEVVSSKSSTALYDDDDESKGTLSFITDDGLLALDPLKPLKIGLQMAGRDDERGLFEDETKNYDVKSNTSLVTKDGLVALNPFQPWTVGLQMAGFTSKGVVGNKANEPWKIAEEGNDHHQSNNLFEDIYERGLVEGVLKQTPIQLPTPEAVASLLGDNDEVSTRSNNSQGDRILYLDADIRIIGDGENHFTIESRACTDEDIECWF